MARSVAVPEVGRDHPLGLAGRPSPKTCGCKPLETSLEGPARELGNAWSPDSVWQLLWARLVAERVSIRCWCARAFARSHACGPFARGSRRPARYPHPGPL